MQQDLKPSSDWDRWTPPDSSSMHEKFINTDKMSDISDPDPADLMSAIAEAGRQQQAPRRKRRKRRRALSTTALVKNTNHNRQNTNITYK